MNLSLNCRSISSIVPIIKIATLLGVVPCYDFKAYKPIFATWFKCYSFCLTCSLTIISVYCIMGRSTVECKNQFSFYCLLDALTEIAQVGTVVVTSFGAIFCNSESWNKLFLQLRLLESVNTNLMSANNLGIFSKSSVLFYIGSLYILSVAIYQSIIWDFAMFLPSVLCFYIQFVCLNLAFNLVLFIKAKYEDVGKLLVNMHAGNIKRAAELYTIVDEVVGNFNRIFGWTNLGVFSGLICQVLSCLTSFTFGFLGWKMVREISFLHLAIVVFGPTILLFCCDATAAEANELLCRCHRLHLWVSLGSREDKELSRLENLMRSKPTMFTAAGFFQMNRATLLYLLSSITTYFIVAIQFRGIQM